MTEASNSKLATRKPNVVSHNSESNYDVRNEINYNLEVLKSNICDYNDAYILVNGDITIRAVDTAQVAFKICTPFTKFITKIDKNLQSHVQSHRIQLKLF